MVAIRNGRLRIVIHSPVAQSMGVLRAHLGMIRRRSRTPSGALSCSPFRRKWKRPALMRRTGITRGKGVRNPRHANGQIAGSPPRVARLACASAEGLEIAGESVDVSPGAKT